MPRLRSLRPLVLVMLGALGLLWLGLYGLQGRIEGGRLREREGIRQALRVEAALLREHALRASFWEGRSDVLRFTLAHEAGLVLEPAPAPPTWGEAFGADAGDRLLLSFMHARTEGQLAELGEKVKRRRDAMGIWIRARIHLKLGQRASARELVHSVGTDNVPRGWEGPYLRLLWDLGEGAPVWALDWLAGRSLDEILALDPEQAGDLRQQAWLRARARMARPEIEALALRQRRLPLAKTMRDGQDLLIAFADPKDSVHGILAQASLVQAALAASRSEGGTAELRSVSDLDDDLGDGILVLPGLMLHPRYPEEELGASLQVLYLLAGTILLAGVLLATRALAKEKLAFVQREDFLRAATHELKTPLASLRLLLESLVSGRITGDEKRAEYLRLMQGETERLSGLVGQALDFRRVDQGDFELDCRDLDLGIFLAEMENLYLPQLEKEGRSLELRCPERLMAHTDPALLRRIVWNLLENARLHGAGTVYLCVNYAGDELLSLEVEDEGEGLDPQEWTRVFEPFARGPGAGEGRVPGIGLGLAIVRRLARAMGGDCRILAAERGFRIQVTLAKAGKAT